MALCWLQTVYRDDSPKPMLRIRRLRAFVVRMLYHDWSPSESYLIAFELMNLAADHTLDVSTMVVPVISTHYFFFIG